MANVVLERLRRKFGDAIVETHAQLGNDTAVVARERISEVAEFLRDDRELAFDMPIDCTAVDWWQKREPRFDVVWHLYSTVKRHRVRLKVRLGEEDPAIASLTPIWRGMNWHEREAYDMYGIRFTGHPGLKRILLYEEFVGHPLRKDYPIDKRQPLVPLRKITDVPTQRQPPPGRLNQP